MKLKAKVLKLRFYTGSTFSIRFERKDFQFKAGQYLVLSVPGISESREYSVASGENDPWLEVLVREIPEGNLTPTLKKLKPGDFVEVEGPFGFFVLNENELEEKEYVFLATGTGISPFQSFVKSVPEINYHLVHGIRNFEEDYGRDIFPVLHRTICTSRDERGNFAGRVTKFLKEATIDTDKIYYLCGNSQMIDETAGILEDAGVPVRNIRSEVFF